MSDKLPCCGNDKVILVDISDHFERKIECSKCATQFYQNKTTGELTKIGKFGKKKKAPDMSDKRPWTPGPWERTGRRINIRTPDGQEYISQIDMERGYLSVCMANAALMHKAPEMAELLIELVSRFDTSPHYGFTTAETIAIKARELLKEIGYETTP